MLVTETTFCKINQTTQRLKKDVNKGSLRRHKLNLCLLACCIDCCGSRWHDIRLVIVHLENVRALDVTQTVRNII